MLRRIRGRLGAHTVNFGFVLRALAAKKMLQTRSFLFRNAA